jgi:hypothetical protein
VTNLIDVLPDNEDWQECNSDNSFSSIEDLASSSDQGDFVFHDDKEELLLSLRNWATSFNISLSAIHALLCILGPHFPFLPKSASTLLKSTNNVVTKVVQNGSFYYFGLRNVLQKIVQPSFPDKLSLALNVDGLPLYRSTTKSFWTLLGILPEIRIPFTIAIFLVTLSQK